MGDWHHINLRKKIVDLPLVDSRVLFAEYNSELKVFFKFVGCLNKHNYIEYPSGKWILLPDTKSKFYWCELPEDPIL